MIRHNPGSQNGGKRPTYREVNTSPQGALVQIGLAIRLPRRESHHSHDGHSHKNNYPDVRNTLVRNGIEYLVRANTVFDHSYVRLPSQTVHAA
jgi:hypothetical protein